MGKYGKLEPDEDHPDSTRNQMLRDMVQIAIANEQAEANRLKLFELRLALTIASKNLSGETVQTLKKNLEDRA